MLRGALQTFVPWTAEEDAVLREVYEREGHKRVSERLPQRSLSSIFHRANRLGLKARRRWSKADDNQLRDLWDSGVCIHTIAKTLGRTQRTTYWRAQQLGLRLGCPDSFEYLTVAAERTGYCTTQLRPILRWAGVNLKVALARPTKARRRFHIVDPFDVDDALERWHGTEPLETAARRLGVRGHVLRRWLRAVGVEEPKDRPFRAHWRVRTADVERAVERLRASAPGDGERAAG